MPLVGSFLRGCSCQQISWNIYARVGFNAASVVQRTSVRHGTQRTSKTTYYDPADFIRDRSPKISRSLYHNPEDWSEEPIYPEIVPDLETPGGIKYTRRVEGEKVAKLATLRDKMRHFAFKPFPVTMSHQCPKVKPKHEYLDFFKIKWEPWQLPGFPIMYNMLPFYQFVTKTSLIQDGLPKDYYSFLEEPQLNKIVDQIRGSIMDALLLEGKYFTRTEEESKLGVVSSARAVIDAIVRAVDLACAKDFLHINELQTGYQTRCEAYWKRWGCAEGADNSKRWGESNEKDTHRDLLSRETYFQYIEGDNLYKLFRHEKPLPEVVPRDSTLVTSIDTFTEFTAPKSLGLETKEFVPAWIPGYWKGDPCEFSTLSVDVPLQWDRMVRKFDEEMAFENMIVNAVATGFGRIVAQAMFLGNSILNEISFPMVTQSIVTNGRDWVFSTYQANSIALWKPDSDNPYQNLCWITKPIKLFEKIEGDTVVGFNDEVLRHFVKQYLKAPVAYSDVNLRPLLPEPVKSYWKTETSMAPYYHQKQRRDGKPRDPYKPEI